MRDIIVSIFYLSALSMSFLSSASPALADANPGYDSYHWGSTQDAIVPMYGGLLLQGGGDWIDDAFRWLISRAPGGDMLVLRTSGTDEYEKYLPSLGGLNSVETLVFHTRQAAFDPIVVSKILHADILYFSGGDQSTYLQDWQNTPLSQAIQLRMSQGMPVGGSSAGLAILGQYIYSSQLGSATSPECLGDPYNADITFSQNFLQIPQLRGLLTETHFSIRDRMGRLITFLSRLYSDGLTPRPRSLAMDQDTVLLLDPRGNAKVLGTGAAYFIQLIAAPTELRPQVPVEGSVVSILKVPAGAQFNADNWTSAPGLSSYQISVSQGQMTSSNGSIY